MTNGGKVQDLSCKGNVVYRILKDNSMEYDTVYGIGRRQFRRNQFEEIKESKKKHSSRKKSIYCNNAMANPVLPGDHLPSSILLFSCMAIYVFQDCSPSLS